MHGTLGAAIAWAILIPNIIGLQLRKQVIGLNLRIFGHFQLLRYGHAASGRLFAIPERSVEDVDAVAHSLSGTPLC